MPLDTLQDPAERDLSSGEHHPENCGQCQVVSKEHKPAPGPEMDTGARSHQDQSHQGNHQDQENSGGPRSDSDFRTLPSPADKSAYHHPNPAPGLDTEGPYL
ncbi:hypothetical protein NQ315_015976 [Exocentrus adspersus]|uniref:Uncharacterized protein n=1 Tax=Exocentrus adspersus TaxID=1586481 RepID=A0AAV8VJ91_9CUCU|nr:hypothetical protein NQ315_015976 [Exocentrus adspersus]